MTGIPSTLLGLAVSGLQIRSSRKLNRPAEASQRQALASLLQAYSRCDYGTEIGLHPDMRYEVFRRRVPLRTYEGLAPWIERMKRAEQNVLWPGACRLFAVSSGTTAGRTKYLPITAPMIEHFRETGLDSLLSYTRRVGSTSVFGGRQLFLGGSTCLAPLPGNPESLAGDLSGITSLHLPRWVDKLLYEPGAEIAQMSDWPAKIGAIARRTWNRDIRLIAGIPSWLLILAEAVRAEASRHGVDADNIRSLWPNLECVVHGGVPVAPYAAELRRVFGRGVNLHEVYPASEGFIAVQEGPAEAGMRLLVQSGLFFEFLPLSRFDEARLDRLGAEALPVWEVEPGIDYALVISTPAGLCRYVIGDVVRFTSTKPPRLVYTGRTRLQLSAFGEHVIEKEATDALLAACSEHGVAPVQFHAAPLFVDAEAGRTRGRHEWWVELDRGSRHVSAEVLGRDLDAQLMRLNEDYEAKRTGGGLEPPLVRIVDPGVFEAWMRANGKWGGQSKMPRCRSDRTVADGLARAAQALALEPSSRSVQS